MLCVGVVRAPGARTFSATEQDADPSASLRAREEFDFARVATLAPSGDYFREEEYFIQVLRTSLFLRK